MTCRCVVGTVEGFVRQVSAHCLPNGFHFYVSGFVREGKDPQAVDAAIMEKYDIAPDKWERYRRRRRGEMNVRYLRHERRFLILATGPVGDHPFFVTEAEVRDAREVPIKFHGYQMSYRGGKTWVRVGHAALNRVQGDILGVSTSHSVPSLVARFQAVPYEPFAGVRYQLFRLLDEVNRRRKAAGLPCVPPSAVRDRLRSGPVFERTELPWSRGGARARSHSSSSLNRVKGG
jgi:hypothetical protein